MPGNRQHHVIIRGGDKGILDLNMRKKSEIVKAKIQIRVGIAMSICSLIVLINNIVVRFPVIKTDVWKAINLTNGILAFCLLLAFLSIILKNSIGRVIQIGIFAILCFGSLMYISQDEAEDLNSVILLVYTIILAIQYDFLRKHFFLKIGAILGIYLFLLIFFLERSGNNPIHSMALLCAAAVLLYLIWIAFAEEMQQYIGETKALKEELYRNQPYVVFGKNVASIVHNLRSKAMAIDGFNELIEDESNPRIKEYADFQKQAIAKQLELINNLMFATKAYQQSSRQATPINDIVRGTIELFKASMLAREPIEWEVSLEEKLWVHSSSQEITQILENLLKNAVEAMEKKAKKKIHVDLKDENGYAVVTVRDWGVGMKICEECKNRDNCLYCECLQQKQSTKPQGTGIGLMYVCDVLDDLGGKIRIKSVEGEGTSVSIFFPKLSPEEVPVSA